MQAVTVVFQTATKPARNTLYAIQLDMTKFTYLLLLISLYSCERSGEYRFPELDNNSSLKHYSVENSDTIILLKENDNVVSKGKLINQKREGTWEEFTSFSADSLSYYKSGVYNYKNGFKFGSYKLYNPNGKIWLFGNYKNNMPDSVFVYFDINGRLDKFEYWKADTRSRSSDLIFSIDL